ncbi:MAG: sporulation protein [Oscillospiraceae bacterium]|nr:sporulation protein [Oscillospiraceae bacterium]
MKRVFALTAALGAFAALFFAAPQVLDCCRFGLRLCAELILPSLFPFFLLSGLLSRLGLPLFLGQFLSPAASRLFRISGTGATAFLIGLTGGYPLGAAYIADLVQEGQIPTAEAEKLLAFCNNSGPAFLVGAIGVGVFGSVRLGLLLYVVHGLAAFLTGIILRRRGAYVPSVVREAPAPPPFARAFSDTVRQTVLSLLTVCGFVVSFTAFAGLLNVNGALSLLAGFLSRLLGRELSWCRDLLTGFWELGGGIGALRGLRPTPINLALASLLAGWGGISVHFQTLALLSEVEIKSAPHTAGRFLSACISFLLTWLISRCLV